MNDPIRSLTASQHRPQRLATGLPPTMSGYGERDRVDEIRNPPSDEQLRARVEALGARQRQAAIDRVYDRCAPPPKVYILEAGECSYCNGQFMGFRYGTRRNGIAIYMCSDCVYRCWVLPALEPGRKPVASEGAAPAEKTGGL